LVVVHHIPLLHRCPFLNLLFLAVCVFLDYPGDGYLVDRYAVARVASTHYGASDSDYATEDLSADVRLDLVHIQNDLGKS